MWHEKHPLLFCASSFDFDSPAAACRLSLRRVPGLYISPQRNPNARLVSWSLLTPCTQTFSYSTLHAGLMNKMQVGQPCTPAVFCDWMGGSPLFPFTSSFAPPPTHKASTRPRPPGLLDRPLSQSTHRTTVHLSLVITTEWAAPVACVFGNGVAGEGP